MGEPVRVQLSRRKGWRMPENTVSVARPHRHGNPWPVKGCCVYLVDGTKVGIAAILSVAGVVDRFRRWRLGDFGTAIGATDHPLYGLVLCPGEPPSLDDLRGKNLACWCPLTDKDGNHVPCHADVLLELANKDTPHA